MPPGLFSGNADLRPKRASLRSKRAKMKSGRANLRAGFYTFQPEST